MLLTTRSAFDSFDVRVETRGPDLARVSVRGEIDLATAARVGAAIEAAVRRARHVVLDLGDVTFMASRGVKLLVDTATLSDRDGFGLAIEPSVAVRDVLCLCGVADRLPLVRSG